MKRRSVLTIFIFLLAGGVVATGQNITLPPNGDNQYASVTQGIGPVRVTVTYNSPDVHAPNGDDRRGKIWGALVPYGLVDLGFGTCKECPWRAGANENTVFTTSHDVVIEGKKLSAGSYGVHMIPGQDEWTVILSKDVDAWGSFFYDPADDALRVNVRPVKSDYHEWLTWEFIDRKPDRATLALQWEELQVPLTIVVEDVASVVLAGVRKELRGAKGFAWQNWNAAARYALQNGADKAEALLWAETAVNGRFVGNENFNSLVTLADAQAANGRTADAAASRQKAMQHPTASRFDLHQYGRRLLTEGKTDEAFAVWQLNAKRHGTEWPTNVGLARGYSALGKHKDALKYAKAALAQAPDDLNRRSLEDAVAKLQRGEDMNR